MVITCEKCGTGFNLDEKVLKPSGSKVRCSVCQHTWSVFPQSTGGADASEHAAEESPASPPAPEPTPDQSSEFSDEDELSQFDPDNIPMPDLDMETDDEDDIDDFDFSDIENLLEADSELTDEDLISVEDEDVEEEITIDFSDIDESILAPEELKEEITLEDDFPEPLPDEPKPGTDHSEPEVMPESDYGRKALSEIFIPEIPVSKPPAPPEAAATGNTETALQEDLPDLDLETDWEPELEAELDLETEWEPELEAELDLKTESETEIEAELDLKTEPETEIEAEPDLKPEPETEESPGLEMESQEPDVPAQHDQVKEEAFASLKEDKVPDPEPPARTSPSETEAVMAASEDHEIKIETDTEPQPGEKKKTSPVMIAVLILALIGGGAYGALTFMGIDVAGMNFSGITSAITGIFGSEGTEEKVYRVNPVKGTINGKFVNNSRAGSLFVITGTVKNYSEEPVSNIKIKGTLLSKSHKPMAQVLPCGNSIAELELTSLDPAAIKKKLTLVDGKAAEVQAGGSVKFMIVFSNLPENLQNFTVEVVGFDKKTK